MPISDRAPSMRDRIWAANTAALVFLAERAEARGEDSAELRRQTTALAGALRGFLSMPENVFIAINDEALHSKSKIYIGRALARKGGGDLDEYQLWAYLRDAPLARRELRFAQDRSGAQKGSNLPSAVDHSRPTRWSSTPETETISVTGGTA
ncbi:hypothetical protein [Bradyrhizobium sp. Arg816]|uniref:hypothetical protein n=1 Tax=Bradyrhizobium sp. Arg816 TaxID=2998491 RepID=UPI00249E0CCC|nr:hypothetical protein [Bradyrhizobium sp. Arg816]MDI3562459.1 hypothetical protein [Bradyrhizobium sp. Arg816]